jgi:hypothetical protein
MISKIGAAVPHTSFGRKIIFTEKPKEPKNLIVDTETSTFCISDKGAVRIINLSQEPYREYLVPGVSPKQILDLYYKGTDEERVICDSITETVT